MLASPQQSARVHGHGVQPWSAGEFYPWHCVIVDNAATGRGVVRYEHPDGRRTIDRHYLTSRRRALRDAVIGADIILATYLRTVDAFYIGGQFTETL